MVDADYAILNCLNSIQGEFYAINRNYGSVVTNSVRIEQIVNSKRFSKICF